ncbi:protein O-mannose kinase-like [Gigantopelta aegis]|uniref:protein O-mannose kinase-like n=1 Tax=Gigantopelta aegis TaxID=1735272 RepID=UPI001B889A3F|nr:protein O-mannose kinase-like [Gigantopelta aegis]
MPPQSLVCVFVIVIQYCLAYSFQQQHTCWWDHFKYVRKCRPSCKKGYFSLPGMLACHPWLMCKDLLHVNSGPTLGRGAVKMVILGSWRGYPVTINKLREKAYKDDFLHGLDMVKLFQPNPRVIQLVGFCRWKMIYFTEYHPRGSADQLEFVMNLKQFSSNQNSYGNSFVTIRHMDTSKPYTTLFTETEDEDTSVVNKENENSVCRSRQPSSFSECSVFDSPRMQWMELITLSKQCPLNKNPRNLCRMKTISHDHISLPVNGGKGTLHLNVDKQIQNVIVKLKPLSIRFQLCLDYIAILSILHNGPAGTRIMCDSNDIHKTLSQYLLTDDLRLTVNDLDALPYVNSPSGITAKCGHHEITGDFVAPEQLWPFDDQEFIDDDMPGYDERTDIWKIPQVCDSFIGDVVGSTTLKLHLFNINTKCKDVNPQNRPSSEEVFKEYENIWRTFKRLSCRP